VIGSYTTSVGNKKILMPYRWLPGYHMRSSLVVKMTKNADNSHTVETLNTMYKLLGEGGNDIFPDMGDNITKIFY